MKRQHGAEAAGGRIEDDVGVDGGLEREHHLVGGAIGSAAADAPTGPQGGVRAVRHARKGQVDQVGS